MRNRSGFTLVEMLVVMALFVVIMAVTGDAFNRIITSAKGQLGFAESNISGQVGLELLRSDIESAGYGLLWSFTNPATYSELAGSGPATVNNDNDRIYAADPTQTNIPRAVVSANDVASSNTATLLPGTDILTVRSHSVAGSQTGKRWSYVESQVLPTSNPSPKPHIWTADNLDAADHVILINPIKDMKPDNSLVVTSGGSFSATFANYSTIGKPPLYNDAEKKSEAYVIYGVDAGPLRMPFNRADYYVRRPSASEANWRKTAERCNPNTGVMFKGVVRHTDGAYEEQPIFDCVLDFQVVYSILTPGSSMTTDLNDISGFTPQQIRAQLKEIKLYILTHDGTINRSYNYPNSTIGVGPGDGLVSGSGRTYNFVLNGVTDWQRYRWKVYLISGRPKNIAGNN